MMWILLLIVIFKLADCSTVTSLCSQGKLQNYKIARDFKSQNEIQIPVYAQSAVLCSNPPLTPFIFDATSLSDNLVMYVGLDPNMGLALDYAFEYTNKENVFRYYSIGLNTSPNNITFNGTGKYTLPNIFNQPVTFIAAPAMTTSILCTIMIVFLLIGIGWLTFVLF